MAGLKGLYVGLGGLVVVGAGALVMGMGGDATLPSGPIDMAAIEAGRSFEGYTLGEASAPVEIVEFADFECPACRQSWVLTIHDVIERLVKTGRVHLVFRDFPLDMHTQSRAAHHAAACVADQGMFWPMHDRLFQTQSEWGGRSDAQRRFRRYAEEVGADVAEYDACMSEGRFRGRIQASVEGGFNMGVGATPSYAIGNRVYTSMSYDEMKAIVDSLAPPTSP